MNIVRRIPLWIKCPVSVFIHQIGRLPIRIVLNNMRWSFVQNRNSTQSTREKVYKKVQMTVYLHLQKKYRSCIEKCLSSYSRGTPIENAPIWVFWWQGEEQAPYIVKICMEHVRNNAGNRPVYIVDSTDFQRFTDVPNHLLEKLRQGKMSVTHFSDYLRMKLLADNGGLWIDASIFVKKAIDDKIFDKPLWTIRNPGCDTVNISNWNWTVGVIGGWKDNVLFHTVSAVLANYWRDYDFVADYFLMDCVVKLVYDNSQCVRESIDSVEPNNKGFYYFQEKADRALDDVDYQEELRNNTWLYKNSWKGKYRTVLPDGTETFYGRWQRDFGSAISNGEEI